MARTHQATLRKVVEIEIQRSASNLGMIDIKPDGTFRIEYRGVRGTLGAAGLGCPRPRWRGRGFGASYIGVANFNLKRF